MQRAGRLLGRHGQLDETARNTQQNGVSDAAGGELQSIARASAVTLTGCAFVEVVMVYRNKEAFVRAPSA